MAFENRVVRTGMVDPKTVMRNPKNWRLHPEAQKRALKDLLHTVGWVDDVKIIDGTDMLVDGHLRTEVALEEGEAEIPAKWVQLTDSEMQLVLLTFDPIAALAQADEERIRALLDDTTPETLAVQQLLADLRAQHVSDPFGFGDLNGDDEHPAFQQFDEGIETEHVCPKCGYAWSGQRR